MAKAVASTSAAPILPTEPAPVAPKPPTSLTLYRGTAIESMTEAQLLATVRDLLAALRAISGMQSGRQIQRVIEGLRL